MTMPLNISTEVWSDLAKQLEGDLFLDLKTRTLYATDASVYREMPLAVVLAKTKRDIQLLIQFAVKHNVALIPRTAGTSLGGQVVGNGIVVDVGPETSTANRAMIGGMVGNNSCGSYSIVYGTTREHVLELNTLLSDGSEAVFKALKADEFNQKMNLPTLEGQIYSAVFAELESELVRKEIKEGFPKAEIHRRNTGYAVDYLAQMQPFEKDGAEFDFCKLLAGSEGTLAFTTQIKLNLEPIPPKEKAVVCIHFNDIQQSLEAVVAIMDFKPRALEMIDKIILDCTKSNKEQEKNRFFVNGDPAAILIVEFWAESRAELDAMSGTLIENLKLQHFGYDYPIVYGSDINKIWSLRKAGLGLLANIPGDAKAVAVIEDTAVYVKDLPAYIAEFTAMMRRFGQQSVYFAHAGAGELHF